MSEQFDAIVIGAGQAGPSLVVALAKANMRVALIERHLIGGTCVNTGCMPTKTLVASARVAHMVRRAADFGVHTGEMTVDMKRVHERAAAVSASSRTSLTSWLEGTSNVSVIKGQARFTGPHRIAVADAHPRGAAYLHQRRRSRRTSATAPVSTAVRTLNNTDMVALAELPKHLVVIGGSYIGLEFAQMYRRFGAKVTIVERWGRASRSAKMKMFSDAR